MGGLVLADMARIEGREAVVGERENFRFGSVKLIPYRNVIP